MRNVHTRHPLLFIHGCGSCANFDSYLILSRLTAGDLLSLEDV